MTTPEQDNLFGEPIDAETLDFIPDAPARPDLFLVLAWSDGNWEIPNDRLWRSVEDATLIAQEISGDAWQYLKIVRIPGETQ